MKYRWLFLSLILITLVNILSEGFINAEDNPIQQVIGKNDAILVKDQAGNVILSKNADNKLIPASTLKVLTALTAFYYLEDSHRFKTEFYLDKESNLIIKGYGDPLLTSEVVSKACEEVKPILASNAKMINHIIIDQSYFEPIRIPGTTYGSYEPYNAPIGALSTNFNTVNFFRDSEGVFFSAEEQTPIFQFLFNQIRQSGLNQGRIILKASEQDLYAGSLFKFFLEKKGIFVKGRIISDNSILNDKKLIYKFESPFTLQDVVKKLLEFSNNYIANQLIVSIGAKAYGAPGNLDKGVMAIKKYTKSQFGITDYSLVEGSGLSRENRISAENMSVLLSKFINYRFLMKSKNNFNFKTGTLTGISTRVGYISRQNNEIYSYVIFCNTPGKSAGKIEQMLPSILPPKRQISLVQ
jgi:D-alanyl-D-alanine carboxypeptidase/D-alanyl-D-alanine-endopeptidase (penicillin-binding protein 4)